MGTSNSDVISQLTEAEILDLVVELSYRKGTDFPTFIFKVYMYVCMCKVLSHLSTLSAFSFLPSSVHPMMPYNCRLHRNM